ncbi:MAG TPA: DsbE family thiol:disulfide interchange protein [Devosiaceae bacterium]|nr:DsbE family thiol:disulfide interchange protein [Devosiaceae bacterium]
MIRSLLVVIPLLVAAALLGLFATQIGRDPGYVPSALIGSKVPEFDLPPLGTVPQPGFATTDLSGQVTVVNVFASWCVPCRAEHPMLMQLAERDDIAVFGINYDDSPENAAAFLGELGNPYAAIGADRDRRVSIDWGVYGVPETFVVDAGGIIVFKHVGPLSPQSFEQTLLPAIEAAKGG